MGRPVRRSGGGYETWLTAIFECHPVSSATSSRRPAPTGDRHSRSAIHDACVRIGCADPGGVVVEYNNGLEIGVGGTRRRSLATQARRDRDDPR